MNILVVSPHPDDETLGAGGTLIKLAQSGHSINWLNITDMKSEDGWDDHTICHRQEQIRKICEFYKFEKFYNLAFPTSKLKNIDEGVIISSIKRVFDSVIPNWIIIPGQYDAHSDHHVVYNCCMAAAKTFRSPYIKRITTMEIPSESGYGFQVEKFRPNLYVDITDTLEDKLKAMKIYDSELESVPFPRSLEYIRSLATIRGGDSFLAYAEAFCIVKDIQ